MWEAEPTGSKAELGVASAVLTAPVMPRGLQVPPARGAADA